MTKLTHLLYVTGLTIHDILNLRASRHPLRPGLYKPQNRTQLQFMRMERNRGRGEVAMSPYANDRHDYQWKNRTSLWEGAAHVLLKAHYEHQLNFWPFADQERTLQIVEPNRRWQVQHAPWQIQSRSYLLPEQRQQRAMKARLKREHGTIRSCPIEHQERAAVEQWAARGF